MSQIPLAVRGNDRLRISSSDYGKDQTETALANQFSVGRQTIREALRLQDNVRNAIEKGDAEEAMALLDRHVCAVGRRFKGLVKGRKDKVPKVS